MERLSNSQEKLIRQLHSRQGRKKSRALLVEGVRSVEAMLAAGIDPEFIVISPSELTERGRAFVNQLQQRKPAPVECEARRFRQLSDAIESQGIMAIATESELPNPDPIWPAARLVVYLDDVNDPGNAGAILRTAAACHADLVVLSVNSADILNPKVIRATAGTIFTQPVQRVGNVETFVGQLQSNNIVLVGSDAHAEAPVDELSVKGRKLCLAFGSEARGLCEEVRSSCFELFRIRIAPEVESFNVAAAAAIAMHDVARRMKLI